MPIPGKSIRAGRRLRPGRAVNKVGFNGLVHKVQRGEIYFSSFASPKTITTICWFRNCGKAPRRAMICPACSLRPADIRPQRGLHCRHICAQLCLKQHLPGHVRQNQRQHRTPPPEPPGPARSQRCGLLAGRQAAHHQARLRSVANGRVHPEGSVRLHPHGRAQQQAFIQLLQAERIQPCQVVERRESPIALRVPKQVRIRLASRAPVQGPHPEPAPCASPGNAYPPAASQRHAPPPPRSVPSRCALFSPPAPNRPRQTG